MYESAGIVWSWWGSGVCTIALLASRATRGYLCVCRAVVFHTPDHSTLATRAHLQASKQLYKQHTQLIQLCECSVPVSLEDGWSEMMKDA